MGERKIVKTTCKGCHGGCGVLVTVEDGVIIHVEGNPETSTEGTMCAKGLSALQHVNNPYRLKYPLQRTGKKRLGCSHADEVLGFCSCRVRIIGVNPGILVADVGHFNQVRV